MNRNALLISDSICKHIDGIRTLNTVSIPGANISSVHQYIKDNTTHINTFSHLILHVGTNDIGSGLTFELIVQYYVNLINLIRDRLKCKIILSTVLPRPVDFEVTKSTVIRINNRLLDFSKKYNFLLVKSFKPFVQQPGSIPKRIFFAKDGLHLNYRGVFVLRNFLIGVVNHLH